MAIMGPNGAGKSTVAGLAGGPVAMAFVVICCSLRCCHAVAMVALLVLHFFGSGAFGLVVVAIAAADGGRSQPIYELQEAKQATRTRNTMKY